MHFLHRKRRPQFRCLLPDFSVWRVVGPCLGSKLQSPQPDRTTDQPRPSRDLEEQAAPDGCQQCVPRQLRRTMYWQGARGPRSIGREWCHSPAGMVWKGSASTSPSSSNHFGCASARASRRRSCSSLTLRSECRRLSADPVGDGPPHGRAKPSGCPCPALRPASCCALLWLTARDGFRLPHATMRKPSPVDGPLLPLPSAALQTEQARP